MASDPSSNTNGGGRSVSSNCDGEALATNETKLPCETTDGTEGLREPIPRETEPGGIVDCEVAARGSPIAAAWISLETTTGCQIPGGGWRGAAEREPRETTGEEGVRCNWTGVSGLTDKSDATAVSQTPVPSQSLTFAPFLPPAAFFLAAAASVAAMLERVSASAVLHSTEGWA